MSTLAASEVTNEQLTQEFDGLFNHSYIWRLRPKNQRYTFLKEGQN